VSIEYAKDIDKWFPLILLHYQFEGKPRKFKEKDYHGNCSSSNMPYVKTKAVVSVVWIVLELYHIM